MSIITGIIIYIVGTIFFGCLTGWFICKNRDQLEKEQKEISDAWGELRDAFMENKVMTQFLLFSGACLFIVFIISRYV